MKRVFTSILCVIGILLVTTISHLAVCQSSAKHTISPFSATMAVSDDCFVNVAETFSVKNTDLDYELNKFSRFIPRTVSKDIVPRSLIVQSTNTVNSTIIKTDEYFQILIELSTPIRRLSSAAFSLSYQLSGPLVVGEKTDSVNFDLRGPIQIIDPTFTVLFSDQIKGLHGFRQFTISPNTYSTLTEKSVSWSIKTGIATSPFVIEFPSLSTFDTCREMPPGSLISISVANLIGIISILIIQLGVIVFLCLSHFRNKNRGEGGLLRYFQYKKLCKKYEHIPGHTQFIPPQLAMYLPSWMLPKGIITSPFQTFSLEQALQTLKTVQQDYYKIVFGIANFPIVVTDSPEFSKIVATKGASQYRKTSFADRTFKELFFGTNVFGEPDHHIWLKHRQLIDQSFAPPNLSYVAQVTNEVLEKDLIPAINGRLEKRDVMVDFANLTMDVIGKAGFGFELDSFHSKPGEETMEQKTTTFLKKADFLRIVPSEYLRKYFKVGPIGELHRVVDSFRNTIRKIIEKREQLMESGQENISDDALSILLRERKNNKDNATGGGVLTNDELVSNAFVLLIAGHETTAKTLGFALYFLSKNPHIQQELHSAIDKLVKETGKETFDFSDYESGRLDYFKAVFNETLRLIPVAFGALREIPKTIECNGVTIPKGTTFVSSFVHTLVNEKYWKDPMEFKPMRFINKNGLFENPQQNPFVFTPFGIGGRICAGRFFALVEGMCVLAKLSKCYSFKLSDPSYKLKTEMTATMRPIETLLIDFIPRK